jgi:hypothetical protein
MIKRTMKAHLLEKNKQSPRCNHKSSQLDGRKKKSQKKKQLE